MTRADFVELSRRWDKIKPSFVPGLFGPEKDILDGLRLDAQVEIDAIQKRLHPRKKKNPPPPSIFVLTEVDLADLWREQEEVQDLIIDATVDDVSSLDIWNVVETSSIQAYSQGFGNAAYARGALRWAEDALTRAGLPHAVTEEKEDGSPVLYRLWAPIEPELLDYIIMNFGRDPLEVNREHNLNNTVLHPGDRRPPF
jgi:hypothetical protein